jgi:MOSC domain-containing protein YiiM
MTGTLKEILIGAEGGGPLFSLETAQIEEGKGIVGDRYYRGHGTFSERLHGSPDVEVTLIEQEEIAGFIAASGHRFEARDFRRNLVTAGVRLNSLVGKDFRVGEVTLRGIRLCEPCAHLAAWLGPEVMDRMVHKAGLRAQVITAGSITVSDVVSETPLK